jgi:hypothetical protein
MSKNVEEGRRWPVKLTRIVLFLGILAIFLLVIAGPAYRLKLLPLLPALLGAAVGFVLFIVTFILAVIAFFAGGSQAFARSRGSLALAVLSLLFTIAAGVWVSRLRGTPPIHDVTTDLSNPPMFKDVVPLRVASGALNPPEYKPIQSMMGKELNVPDAQRRAFPDIQSVVLSQPPAQAVQLANQAAKDMGWDIVAVDPSEGRIEATDTTRYFGFKDDVVVRIVAESTGSRVDVRSESRVGGGDAGTNAKRVRGFLAKLRVVASR